MDVGLTSRYEWGFDCWFHQRMDKHHWGSEGEDGRHWCQTFWRFLKGLGIKLGRELRSTERLNHPTPFISVRLGLGVTDCLLGHISGHASCVMSGMPKKFFDFLVHGSASPYWQCKYLTSIRGVTHFFSKSQRQVQMEAIWNMIIMHHAKFRSSYNVLLCI